MYAKATKVHKHVIKQQNNRTKQQLNFTSQLLPTLDLLFSLFHVVKWYDMLCYAMLWYMTWHFDTKMFVVEIYR